MSQTARTLLALNFGSSSLKAASFLLTNPVGERTTPQELGRITVETSFDDSNAIEHDARKLLAQAVQQLPTLRSAPALVAHRIVHGGDRPSPLELTPATMDELQALSTLAPLHQPPALALVHAASLRWPYARQIGVFDTSWHQTMPERHRTFAIPYPLYLRGVKRYGFHGLAFQSAMRQLPGLVPELAHKRLVLAHLGGGSSLCAVVDGRCVSTTMGMTPLGGIPMSTRPGSLDPGVLLHLQRHLEMSADEIDQLLWRESGLKGISGETGDMRKLLTSESEGARLAISIYVAAVVREIAAMATCMRGIDGLVFSGGIGAHAVEIRSRVAEELDWLGLKIDPALNRSGAREISASQANVKTFALSIDEELELALACASLAA